MESKTAYRTGVRIKETVRNFKQRCMRNGKMTGTSPELLDSMHVTASVSARYKYLQD